MAESLESSTPTPTEVPKVSRARQRHRQNKREQQNSELERGPYVCIGGEFSGGDPAKQIKGEVKATNKFSLDRVKDKDKDQMRLDRIEKKLEILTNASKDQDKDKDQMRLDRIEKKLEILTNASKDQDDKDQMRLDRIEKMLEFLTNAIKDQGSHLAMEQIGVRAMEQDDVRHPQIRVRAMERDDVRYPQIAADLETEDEEDSGYEENFVDSWR